MRYEIFESVGESSVTKTYEGTPQEIQELMKLQKNTSSKLCVTINGDVAAQKIKNLIVLSK